MGLGLYDDGGSGYFLNYKEKADHVDESKMCEQRAPWSVELKLSMFNLLNTEH